MKLLELNLKTPTKEIFNGQVRSVAVTTTEGRMVVLPGHIDLTGNISFSDITMIDQEGVETTYFARNGIIYVDKNENTVDILCLSIKEKQEIKPVEVERYLKWIEKQLSKSDTENSKVNQYQIQFLENEKISLVKKLEDIKK
jgi:F-type H+-transporting ATPase subunit epsilon